MNFRDLMTTLEQIDKPILSEALTLSAIIALTSGYEQDDKVRIPKLADLAKQNNLEGLVDPVTGKYVSNEGDEDDEVPFEIAEKLSAAGLLPTNAKLPQAGWFDNNRVFDTANKNLLSQSSSVADRHELIMAKLQLLRDLAKQIVAFRDKRATTKMQDMIGEKPILPSNAPSPELARLTPTFPSQTMAGINESAGLADALMESFEYLYEDLKDQEWSFRRPEVAQSSLPADEFYRSRRNPELRNSANTAISDLRQPTTKSLPGGEYNASNIDKPTSSSSVSDTAAPKTAPKSGVMDVNKFGNQADRDFGKLKGIPLAKELGSRFVKKEANRIVPILGTAWGLADGARRFSQGDYTGVGLDAASAIASNIPHPAAQIGAAGLDAYNIYRDYDAAKTADEEDAAAKEAPAVEPNKEAPAVEPTKETPPVKSTRNDPVTSTKNFQTYLKSLGANLGKTGPNRDGIDGVVGPLTKAAIAKYILNGR